MNHCFEKTLYYTSPGHGGWGIIRVAAMIPQSHLLFICPSACFRHGALGAIQHGYKDRTSYLYITPEDVVTGYDEVILEGAEELLEQVSPKVLFLFVSCMDDFIGTDMDSLAKIIEERHEGLVVRACHMNPIASETTRPPLITTYRAMLSAIPQTYSLKEKKKSVNLLGNFAPISRECEIYDFMNFHGIDGVCQLADYDRFEDYCCMAESSYNILVSPIARYGSEYMDTVFGTKTAMVLISYDMDEIEQNYRNIEQFLNTENHFDFTLLKEKARIEIDMTLSALNGLPILVSDSAVLRPFSLAKALLDYGFCVREIIAQEVTGFDRSAYDMIINKYKEITIRQPQHYRAAIRQERENNVVAIGYEGAYLRQCDYVVDLSGDEGMYGYYGVIKLMQMLRKAIAKKADLRKMIEDYGAVV